jgi:DNA replication protein DnaC
VAGAIVDRLLHNATVLNIRGHSYRMRAHQEPTNPRGGPAVVR